MITKSMSLGTLQQFWRLHTREPREPVKLFRKMDIGGLRHDYNDKRNLFLEEHIEKKEPFDLFKKWFELVKNDQRTVEPNAVCLSTCSKDGTPSGRFVLLKGFGKEGFKFFTHYTSRKGQELEENPKAALTFYWEHFSRSVRVEGTVEKLPFEDADEYFSKRPYQSQIGALCSDQSKPIPSRDVLSAREKELKAKYNDGEVPRPPLWGGYLVKPQVIEFWQGQTDRIHDRIRFRYPKEGEPDGNLTKQAEDGWIYERLLPENGCIAWKCNKANHEDFRPNKPILIVHGQEIENEEDKEPIESKWIPVLPGVISQKAVNESKRIHSPF